MDWLKNGLLALVSAIMAMSVRDYVLAALGFSACLCIPAFMEKYVVALSPEMSGAIKNVVLVLAGGALISIPFAISGSLSGFNKSKDKRREKDEDIVAAEYADNDEQVYVYHRVGHLVQNTHVHLTCPCARQLCHRRQGMHCRRPLKRSQR